MSELKATINQSMADKIVKSVNYPFTVFEHRKPFEGFSFTNEIESDDEINIESEQFLKDIKVVLNGTFENYEDKEQELDDLAVNFSTEIRGLRENFEECLVAYNKIEEWNTQNPDQKHTWDGPTKDFLESIIKDIKAYESNSLQDYKSLSKLIEIKAQITWIRVILGKEPNFLLNGQRFDVSLPSILPSGTAEVWAKYKWLKCTKYVEIFGRKICVGWKWTTKLTKLLSITLKDIKFKVKAHAIVKPKGAIVNVYGAFDELRLDYRFIDRIPLEKLANKILGDKPLTVFDASVFVKTIPVLNSSFRVSKIEIPNEANKIAIDITVDSD